MNRRDFARNLAGAALGAGALTHTSRLAAGAPPPADEGEAPGVPFKLSVMLWTVFQRLPFEQRLEKVAEAGYKNVELVGEYKKWSEDDFRRANSKRRALGLTFDTTAGLAHGVGDPRIREAFLSDLQKELGTMAKIECPSIIIMSGNVVPGLSTSSCLNSTATVARSAPCVITGKETSFGAISA